MPIIHDDHRTHKESSEEEQQEQSLHVSRRAYSTTAERRSCQIKGIKRRQLDQRNGNDEAEHPYGEGNKRWHGPANRLELIDRIKRGESPSWHPNGLNDSSCLKPHPAEKPLPLSTNYGTTTSLLPSPELDKSSKSKISASAGSTSHTDILRCTPHTEQPMSALHAGDFRERSVRRQLRLISKSPQPLKRKSLGGTYSKTATSGPWNTFSDTRFYSENCETRPSATGPSPWELYQTRSRALSYSALPSSFILHPPTSPLAQQSNNTDLDFSLKPSSRQSSQSPERNNRRRTFSPRSLEPFHLSPPNYQHGNGHPARLPSRLGSGDAGPVYQAHQPRRSLCAFQNSCSNPQPPLARPRRPSASVDLSPLQHAPMVGSYEESILRGRMSTTPSKPLNFVARIGVLGKGECRSSLRCPPHAIVPFPAVFYSYGSGNGNSVIEDGPSPYVGLIDLETMLKGPSDHGAKQRRKHVTPTSEAESRQASEYESSAAPSAATRKHREKKKRRSTSPKAPPGGSYRIPQQGQLQIIILNPNKTAVKLFLVPYDLSGMEAGQKTFIRQRSYSAGPVIDMPITMRTNLGTDRPEAALSSSDDPRDRPVLRYLIHLHICCPSKGRFFLYKSIRVVFANRLPDGTEKLRNEIQLPEPRYSVYKPDRSTASTGQDPAASRINGRTAVTQSTIPNSRPKFKNNPFETDPTGFSTTMDWDPEAYRDKDSTIPTALPRPVQFLSLPQIDSRPASRSGQRSDDSSNGSRPTTAESNPPHKDHLDAAVLGLPGGDGTGYCKLKRGDSGYGGYVGASAGAETVEGLIARRLKCFNLWRDEE